MQSCVHFVACALSGLFCSILWKAMFVQFLHAVLSIAVLSIAYVLTCHLPPTT